MAVTYNKLFHHVVYRKILNIQLFERACIGFNIIIYVYILEEDEVKKVCHMLNSVVYINTNKNLM